MNQVSGVPEPRKHHSALPVEEPKLIEEPGLSCELCGEKIENIASCLTTAIGGYAHFDCVLDHLRKLENLKEEEILSYTGSGNFGVFTKSAEGKYSLVRTINWETPERVKHMKEFVEGLKK